MSDEPHAGMSRHQAQKLEYGIIALGVLALVLILQPFSLMLFSIGCMLVVLAGLVNNLLPLAQTGVKVRTVVTIAMVVAMIFCIVLLVSIAAAHLYGVFFLNPPDPATAARQGNGRCTEILATSLRSECCGRCSSTCRFNMAAKSQELIHENASSSVHDVGVVKRVGKGDDLVEGMFANLHHRLDVENLTRAGRTAIDLLATSPGVDAGLVSNDIG